MLAVLAIALIHSCSGDGPEVLRHGHQGGHFATHPRHVTLHWRAQVRPDPREIDFTEAPVFRTTPRYPTARVSQSFTTEFYATAAGAAGPDTLIVAGTPPEGGVRIERWRLVWPEEMPQPRYDLDTDSTRVEAVLPERTGVTWLREASDAAVGRVTGLAGIVNADGAVEALLVHFDAQSELHRLDLATGRLTFLLSATHGTGSLRPLPELADDEFVLSPAPGHDNSYRLVAGRRRYCGHPLKMWPDRVLLIDRDGDGALDESRFEVGRPPDPALFR